MKEIRLLSGAHPRPFDEQGNATMCVQEYVSYLAGERHSDTPKCVSRVLTTFMVFLNDSLDDETRQRLRPYAVRQIGTHADGQDRVRSYMALDWLIRTYTPAFLDLAGLQENANRVRELASIEGLSEARAACSEMCSVNDTAEAVSKGIEKDVLPVVSKAAHGAFWGPVWRAARQSAEVSVGEEAWSLIGDATWFVTWAAANFVSRDVTVENTAWVDAWFNTDVFGAYKFDPAIASAAATVVRASAVAGALSPTVEMLRESGFELLDRMIDPAGIHDIKPEEFWFDQTGREPLVQTTKCG